ncbi:MAG: O-antigen ligase family protein [Verrucomicrobia bacterium]|nr:O-antigen ligase family protein [Verrucomicrobiota bacterium]
MIRPGRIALRDFFRTPHDWMMLVYFVWIVWNAPSRSDAFKDVTPLFLIYVFIVQALSSTDRIIRILYVWGGLIYFISMMAVLSEYGFDPAGSYDMTHGWAKGRLVFNTSMFDNPNALGHSVAPVIPLIYFLLFWRRPIFVKEVAGPMMALPVYCVLLTESKGAFISSFVAIVAALTFGRPKLVQAIILTLAVTVGWGAMYSLPRFTDIKIGQSRQDEALLGRLNALEYGLRTMRNNTTGVGYKQWFPSYQHEVGDKAIASHNAYNQIGTELGWTGLMFFVGILYTALRTLVTANTSNIDEERVRRTLFVFTVSFAVSAWVIDFAYRPTFFMIIASVAAFHRCLLNRNPVEEVRDPLAEFRAERPVAATAGGSGRLLQPAPGTAMTAPRAMGQMLQPNRPFATPGKPAAPPPKSVLPMPWTRLGIVDAVIVWIATTQVERLWEYVIKNF